MQHSSLGGHYRTFSLRKSSKTFQTHLANLSIASLMGQRFSHIRTSGFSLVELMIVVVVLAIVAAIAMPMLGDTSISKLREAAQLLAADVDYARVESIAHGDDPRLLVVDVNNNTYHIAARSDSSTPITNPVGKLPYQVTFGQGRANALTNVTIQSASLDGDDELEFGIYGQTDQATAATITLECEGSTLTISIDPTTGETAIGDIN